jgi:predicted transcriptional regulator
MVAVLLPPKTQSGQGTFENLKTLEDMCRHCTPITPVQCISLCRFYKLKNELRNLRTLMTNPNYATDFFDVLKNQNRLHVFQAIVNGRCTLDKIQGELKKTGAQQSQYTISNEYIQPLITIGLVTESLGKYNATTFGVRISELLEGFEGFVEKLPPQSECHEESLLQMLISGPKTCEEIKQVISPTIASRIVKRLATSGLINLPTERNYIFFHKSKRDPAREELTDSAMKVYKAIPDEGVAADKLAKLVGLSQRRTYKHIRHLKGKKLVFVRNIPRTYSLTEDGQKLATTLQNLSLKVEETWSLTEYVAQPANQRVCSTNSFLH